MKTFFAKKKLFKSIFPFISSVLLHTVFFLAFYSLQPLQKLSKQKNTIKEHFVSFSPSSPLNQSQENFISSPKIPSSIKEDTAFPKEAPAIPVATRTPPQQHPLPKRDVKNIEKPSQTYPSPSPSPQKTIEQRTEKLRELAKIANEMTKRLETDNHRLNKHKILFKTNPMLIEIADSFSEKNMDPVLFSNILKKHLVLPLPGIIRLHLTISPEGQVLNCEIHECETNINRQYVLKHIYEISFKELAKKHKFSKNISFQIKLVSEAF